MSEIFNLPKKSVDWNKYKSDPSVNANIVLFERKLALASRLDNTGLESINSYIDRLTTELISDFALIEEKIAEVKKRQINFLNQLITTGATVFSLVFAGVGIYYSNKTITLTSNTSRPYLAVESAFKDPTFILRFPPYAESAVYASSYFGTLVIKLSNVGISPADKAVVQTILFNNDMSLFYESKNSKSEIANPILKDLTVQLSEQLPYHPQILQNKTLVVIINYFDSLTDNAYKQVLYYKFDVIDNQLKVLFEDSEKVKKLSIELENINYI